MKFIKQKFEYKNRVLIENAIFEPPFRFEKAYHNQGCFLYMKEAGMKFLSSNDSLSVETKDAVLLKCGTYFVDFIRGREDERVEVIAIHFYPEILKEIYSDELPSIIEKQTSQHKIKQIGDDIMVAKFIESLEFYFENPSLVNDDLLLLKIKELILLLIQTKNVSSVLELITDLYSTRIANVKEVVNLHLYSNLSVEELAKLCHLSLSSFKREFKKQFNLSPTKYINIQKLKKAKELLTISDLPIGEIAYEVGFNDPLYFTRFFKKSEGIPPSAYRAIQIA